MGHGRGLYMSDFGDI